MNFAPQVLPDIPDDPRDAGPPPGCLPNRETHWERRLERRLRLGGFGGGVFRLRSAFSRLSSAFSRARALFAFRCAARIWS